MKSLMILAIASCACLPAYPQAQSNAGEIRGSVTDASGSAIRGAKLQASDPDRAIQRNAESNEAGEFVFPVLPPGRYRVRVEAQGFTPQVFEQVEVRVGDTFALPVRLEVGELQQVIEVVAEPSVVDSERAQQATTIDRERITQLPINRRNYLDFALLSPATSSTQELADGTDYRVAQTPQSGISFGGGNGRGNGFYIDGAENYINSGGVRLSVSQEAVQEFQINRNTASAEFGWSSGGTVNIVTRSGSNQFHGNFFGFLRHRDIQARNFFDPQKSAYTRSQAGATAGGPLRRDRSFFFAAYERLDRHESTFVPILQDRSAFNAPAASQQPLLNALRSSPVPQIAALGRALAGALTPAANPFVTGIFQANSGVFPFSESSNLFSFRLDHRFSDRHNLYWRGSLGSLDNQNNQFGALVAYNRGRNFDIWDGTSMLSDSIILNSAWVVETRLMFNHNRIAVRTVDAYGPELNVTGFGFFGREIFLPSRTEERHYQIMQNWNRHSSSHDLKFGFDINPVRDFANTETFFSGRFNFGEAVPLQNVIAGAAGAAAVQQISQYLQAAGQSALLPALAQPVSALQAFALGLPTFYQQGFGDPRWTGWSRRFGLYVQDAWRARRNLTLHFGLRYDVEGNESVIGTDKNNFGPRFAFSWSPGKEGKTVLRGGYGVFFSPTNLQIANVADALSGRYINQVFVPLTGIPVIINPATGRPATSADIYQGLLKRGVLGRRSITPDDLKPFGVPVGPGLPLRVEFGSDPLRQGYAQQASFEIERAFGEWAVSAAWNYNHGLGFARITGRNLVYTGQRNPNGTPQYARIDPTLLQKNIFTYDGNAVYHAGILQVQRRLNRNFALTGHYTWSKAIDDFTDFNSDFSPMDQLCKRCERSVSAFHHTHRAVIYALYQSSAQNALLRGWDLAPIFSANSWRPFNVLAGLDVNGDNYTTNDRPYPAGRNIGRGPNLFTFDLRLSRRFRLASESTALEVLAEGFNLANRTNFRTVNNTVGAVPLGALPARIEGIAGASPTTPLAFTSAHDARQFQFALKIFW